jgi:adenosylhomocysteine nucleosidase
MYVSQHVILHYFMRIGIIGAMQQEIAALLVEMNQKQETVQGGRTFYEGTLYGKEVVLVFSRWGKVAAATTATQLILDFKVDLIVFTGIAGGLAHGLHVGDVVIARRLYQHDMDARPLLPQYEIPLSGKMYFESPARYTAKANAAVSRFLETNIQFNQKLRDFGIHFPKVLVGDIASGDQFVSSLEEKQTILHGLPSVACVEMEGAAVAQVCSDFEIPVLLIRTISDEADEHAHHSFEVFLEQLAPEYAHYILKELFALI